MQSDHAPANTEARTGVIAPVMHHVNLKTIRLQELIDWYGTLVGMTPTHQFEGGAWLTNDAANHRLALLTVPGLEDDPDTLRHTGLHHTAFEYASMDDLLDTYERLKSQRILRHGCLDHGMTTSFYYADPIGKRVDPTRSSPPAARAPRLTRSTVAPTRASSRRIGPGPPPP